MPVFNCARYVEWAVRSVLSQSHRDFVLHIFDDGSTDGTGKICRQMQWQDSRIQLHQHKNIGIANTMNAAIDELKADWIFCMHGDDVMFPHRLQRQWRFICTNPQLAVVSSLVRLIDQNGRDIGGMKNPYTDPTAAERAVAECRSVTFNHPAAAFRPEVIKAVGGYRQEFWPAEDTELWNRVATAGHRVAVIDEYLLKYRVHSRAASTQKSRMVIQKLAWMSQCLRQRHAHQPEPTWEEFLAEQRRAPWLERLNNRRRETARTLYQGAIHRFAAGNYAALLPTLAAAAILEPGLVLPRILPRLIFR